MEDKFVVEEFNLERVRLLDEEEEAFAVLGLVLFLVLELEVDLEGENDFFVDISIIASN